jgi:hypothetical protein
MEEKKDFIVLSAFLKLLGEVVEEYSVRGEVDVHKQQPAMESLRNILRLSGTEKKNSLLNPADGRKEVSIIADFLDSLSQVLRNYAGEGTIPQNLQTHLKTRLREILELKS